jgi:hypothetical protein
LSLARHFNKINVWQPIWLAAINAMGGVCRSPRGRSGGRGAIGGQIHLIIAGKDRVRLRLRRVQVHVAPPGAGAACLNLKGASAMTKTTSLLLALVATTLACSLFAMPAQAAARARVFVASYGNDANPCTFGSPCKTFQNAYNVVAPGGEVTAIDSAGFGPLLIEHSVTITSPNGVEAGIVAAPGNTAITINAGSTDVITLHGLTLDGSSTAQFGIVFSSGAALTVEDCVFRNFTVYGLGFSSATTTTQTLAVSNSYFINNGQDGINIETDASGAITAAIDRTRFYNNSRDGLIVYGNSTGATNVGVTDSVAEGNGTYGIIVQATPGNSGSNLSLKNSLVEGNGNGVEAYGASSAVLWLAQSMVTGNTQAYVADAGGVIYSYGDNYIDTSNGSPTGSLTLFTKQ